MMFVEAGRLEWVEVSEPSLTDPAAVVVKPLAVARCDLDLPMAAAGLFPGPFAVGHETVAEVVAVGAAVTRVRCGKKVLVPFQISCGSCPRCVRHHYAACSYYRAPLGASFGFGSSGGDHGGALCDLLLVPAADHLLLTAPDAMANEGLATLSDNVTDAYRAVGPALAARPGADVLIVAATPGSISLYAAALALTLGAGTVRYLDVDADRVETAVALGADATHHEGPWPRRLERAEITVDATGQPDGLATVIRSTEPYGLCTSVAVYFDPTTPMPLLEMYTHGITFHTSRADSRRYLPDVIDLVAHDRYDPLQVPTTIAAWQDAPEAWLRPATKLVLTR